MHFYFFCIALVFGNHLLNAQQVPIWGNKSFALYKDSIRQGKFTAKLTSENSISSNYESPAYLNISPAITFKFSINGKDNEMVPGVDHHMNCVSAFNETPIIKFGKQFVDTTKMKSDQFLLPNTKLHIRLDMREVFEGFNKQGFYTLYNGTQLYAKDFRGLYVAGATDPLNWDFDNLFQKDQLTLKDADGDHIYETTITFNEEKKTKDIPDEWRLSKDISNYPQYHSEYPISDALYKMALEEMVKAIEPDSTFRTGKEWAGVWTRDISYSIILSMAHLQPRVAMISLMKKVKNGKIIQDTGTGGAWPISTDRMIWATAAWELYKATGDKDWLQQSFQIIKQSIEDDMQNVYDEETGLVKGESSFLDWREQTYPKWMQPADIFESFNLGTNALHYQANIVLTQMAEILSDDVTKVKHRNIANKIKSGINQYLWMKEKGYYGQYLYGRIYKTLSPRSEALGEALSIWFGIADSIKAKQITQKTPVLDFGIPCIYPQIPGISSYHNNAVWPFVQTYWALAAKTAKNEQSVMHSMANLWRAAAMFLTNKENYVADNGDYKGTVINSSNMLWSLSGNIALIHKVLFGIEYQSNGMNINPFIPEALKGKRSLTNYQYRNAKLDIQINGFGYEVKNIRWDGKPAKRLFIPDTLTGYHRIEINLNNRMPKEKIQLVSNAFSPPTPTDSITKSNRRCATKMHRQLILNGKPSQKFDKKKNGIWQIIDTDLYGLSSFASEPYYQFPKTAIQTKEIESLDKLEHEQKGFHGNGYAEISKTKNKKLEIEIEVNETANYLLDFRYANGSGPVNTENKCSIRTLQIDDVKAGTIVFPQRGNEEWSNWGYSNAIKLNLSKGKHKLSLSLETWNENMHGEINKALVDEVRVVKL